MKSFIKITLAIFILSTSFSACKKYPDGPSLSIISRKERMANTWHIAAYYENNVDKTSDFNSNFQSAKMVMDKAGNYSLYYKLFGSFDYNESGSWNFANNDMDFITTPNSSSGSVGTHHILKLRESELWYKEDPDGSGITREYHLKP